MRICYVDKKVHEKKGLNYGCQMWGKCLDADFLKDTDNTNGYDIAIISFYGGSYDIPSNIRKLNKTIRIIGVFDYNSWEMHEVIGLCNGSEGPALVDAFICPKPLSDWLKAVYQKPVIESYRPYEYSNEYLTFDQREKIILISEHTKTRQVFTEKMIAKRILEQIPNSNEYKIIVKETCRGDHPYPTGRVEHPTINDYFNTNFEKIDKWSLHPIPLLSIDHYPAALFGGFHAANAFNGTPTIGVCTSGACVQAFPELVSEQYNLPEMIANGVKMLTRPEDWTRVSREARAYAINNWSFEACKKLFYEQISKIF